MAGVHEMQNPSPQIEHAVEDGDVMAFSQLISQGALDLGENDLRTVAGRRQGADRGI